MKYSLTFNKLVKLSLQVTIWIAIFLFPFLVSPFYQSHSIHYTQILALRLPSFLFLVSYYYVNLHYIIPAYFFNKKILQYILITIAIFTCLIIFFFLTIKSLSSVLPSLAALEGYSYRRFGILSNLVFFILISAISLGQAYKKERESQSLIRKQIEIEKLQSELSVLKLQISPHFLFNTLNNIRYLARIKSDNTENAILQLSDILRHITYDASRDTVSLSSEVSLIQNVTALQELRLNSSNTIKLDIQIENLNSKITPLLFMPLIENAFKYGFSDESTNEVKIKLIEKDKILDFEIINKKLGIERDSMNSGLGLKNLKRRLELSYPDSHQFSISEDTDEFKVRMQINLNKL